MTPAERLAILTTPVAMLGRAADQTPARNWRLWGRGAQWADRTAQPRLALAVTTWSWPLHMATRSTPTRRVWRSPEHWDSPGYYPTVGSPTRGRPAVIPWDSKWSTASGEDRGVLIDYTDDPGRGIEALGLRAPFPHEAFLIAWATAADGDPGQYQDGDLIADALAVRTVANAGTYDFRGSGGPKRWGVVTADEVRSGDIGHAMAITGLTRWGPAAGFVAPATRVEWPSSRPTAFPSATVANDVRLAQGGTRLALPISDAEIEAWADRRGHIGAARATAVTFARALRDWGAWEAESGSGDPQIETTREGFSDLGITAANEATLLDGLPWERLYVVAVPT